MNPLNPLIAAINNLRNFVKQPLSFMNEMHAANGDLFSIYLAHKKFHFLATPEAAEHILSSHSHHYRKSRLIFDKIKPITGNQGLVQLEGNDWKEMRKMTSEVFHRAYLDHYVHIIDKYTDKLINEIDKNLAKTNVIDISSLMVRNTISIAVRLFCGASYDQEASNVARKFVELNFLCGQRMRQVISHSLLPTTLNRRIKQLRHELDAIFLMLIESTTQDSLSLLAKLKKELHNHKNKNDLIKDQMMTFMFAGYETTAASLTFCFHLLAQHTQHQQKIRDELASGLSEHVDCVYREALRLYPPAYMLAREALHDDKVSGLEVRKGDNIILSLYEIHRHNDYWEKSNAFLPERFLKQNDNKSHKFLFIPFGYGKRVCSGIQLAFIEAGIVLKKLLQRFEFSLVDTTELQIEAMVTLHPKDAVNLTIEPL